MAEELKIVITADADQAQRGLSGLRSGLGRVGTLAAGAALAGITAAGVGLVALGANSVSAASDVEEMQAKFDTVFREMAGPTADALGAFAEEAGRSRFELMGFAATLQDTFVPLGFARDEAANMSVELVKLAEDLASFNNLDSADVVRDLQSAMVGNTETLRKYGVVASQAAIENFALENGLLAAGEEMDAQTKAAAILGITLAGTTDAQGDAIRTADSWANQQRALSAALLDTKVAIGNELLPVLTPLLTDLGEMARVVLPALTGVFAEFIGELRDSAGPAMLIINKALTDISAALGLAKGDVSLLDVALGGLRFILDGVVASVQFAAIFMNVLAGSLSAARQILDRLAGSWRWFGDEMQRAVDRIPDWLRPGSPTPFETGLRGIAAAMRDLNNAPVLAAAGGPARAGGAPSAAGFSAPASAGGAGTVVIRNVNINNGMDLAQFQALLRNSLG